MQNQTQTYFSGGIVNERQSTLYKLFIDRFNNLEDGEILDITFYDDMYFYNYLHKDFKKKYMKPETNYIFSMNLK